MKQVNGFFEISDEELYGYSGGKGFVSGILNTILDVAKMLPSGPIM